MAAVITAAVMDSPPTAIAVRGVASLTRVISSPFPGAIRTLCSSRGYGGTRPTVHPARSRPPAHRHGRAAAGPGSFRPGEHGPSARQTGPSSVADPVAHVI